jgi:hypothetical protein
MSAILQILCAWCGAILQDGSGPVSHGLCATCLRRELDEDR